MLKESKCLKISKKLGQKALLLTNKLGIGNTELEIKKEGDFICIPITGLPNESDLQTFKKQFADYEIAENFFREKSRKTMSFAELLEKDLAPHLLASLPRALDFVGDVAIIEIPLELDDYKNIIGEAVLKSNKNVRTVLAKAGAVSGVYRLREFQVIAGEPKTETLHKEYGCQYYIDVTKAYFSPRLSYEHHRISSLVREDETIIDMFTGVGPFAIQIAKAHSKVRVYAIDANPEAIEYLKRNIRINRVDQKVFPVLGDARQIVNEKLLKVADRAIMNLPEKAMDFVDVACSAIRPDGGVVHFYSFINKSDSMRNLEDKFRESVQNCDRKVEKILSSRLVRETAPHEWQCVLDARII